MVENTIYNELRDDWDKLLNVPRLNTFPAPEAILLEAASPNVRPVALFAELEDARTSWDELFKEIRSREYSDKLVTRFWTLKDMAAHVASWAKEFRRQVEMVANGEAFDYAIANALSDEGPNEWNRVEVEKRRHQSLDESMEEFESETRSLQELVLTLPQEVIQTETDFPIAPTGDPSMLWKGNIGQIVAMKCLHDQWHTSRVRQWFESIQSSR